MKKLDLLDDECFLCGSRQWLEVHHVFGGANRKISEKYGLKVKLCHYCHNEPPFGVHHNAERMLELRKQIQQLAMQYYGWSEEEFIEKFGRSYL